MKFSVIEVLRDFLPGYLAGSPRLDQARRRAIWAWQHCRTSIMGGHVYACPDCREKVFVYHSCNHRSCPQCGSRANERWVTRELQKRVGAPYFLVTFTLPQELRSLFFGPEARECYDLFFQAAARALREKLAHEKWLGAATSGFTAVLHTWNQRLHFHPHLHFLVPGAGLDATGRVVVVKNGNFLVPVPALTGAFREAMKGALAHRASEVDPAVWRSTRWAAVHIQPCGSGQAAVKYLGRYISRSAISDSRMVRGDEGAVTFRWKDRRQGDRERLETIPGEELITRLLRHVLPKGLRAVRYYGWCHPAAKCKREVIALATGRALLVGDWTPETSQRDQPRCCPGCRKELVLCNQLRPKWQQYARPPPS